jgi:hypothetical protein
LRSPEELEVFLVETLLPELARLREEVRALRAQRDALRLPWRAKAAIWAAGAVVLAFLPSVQVALAVLAVPFLIDVWRMRRIRLPGAARIRNQFVKRVIEFLDPDFSYEPRGHISREEFAASGLFEGADVDRYTGEDLVRGKHGPTAFRFSELRAARKRGSGKNVRWEPVFSGLFLVADFNKHFQHPLFVLPDRTERHLGGMTAHALQSLPFQSSSALGELVQLEDPAFERCFKVYGRDEVEARYILSPALMRRLVRFRETTNDELRLSFVGGSLHLALPLPADLFQLRRVDDLDADLMRSWASDLAFVTGILDDLDLDTRIWSKAPDPDAVDASA